QPIPVEQRTSPVPWMRQVPYLVAADQHQIAGFRPGRSIEPESGGQWQRPECTKKPEDFFPIARMVCQWGCVGQHWTKGRPPFGDVDPPRVMIEDHHLMAGCT